ncbi:unnamed protein product [Arabidopsis halleri]
MVGFAISALLLRVIGSFVVFFFLFNVCVSAAVSPMTCSVESAAMSLKTVHGFDYAFDDYSFFSYADVHSLFVAVPLYSELQYAS